LSNFSQKLCFCYNYFIYHYANDGLNKNVLKINQISSGKIVKDQAYMILLNSRKVLNYFEENLTLIIERSQLNKKSSLDQDNKNNNNYERQNNIESVIKK